MLKSIVLAISFLTCLPVNTGPVVGADLRRALGFFPFAGLVLGIIVTGWVWLGMYIMVPGSVLAVLATILLAYLTRGLHLDGVADLADGFGGSFDGSRRLEIMKDSATGSFGVVALCAVLALKAVCFNQLFSYGYTSLVVIVMAIVAARFWMVVLAYRATYARDAGTGHFIIGQVRGTQIFMGALFLVPLYLAPLPCLAVLVVSGLPPLFLRIRATQLIGGLTGHVLGAAVEWSEAFGLLGGLLYLGMVFG